MADLVSSDEVFAYLEECLTGKHGPTVFLSAHKLAADRGYGRVPTAVESTADSGITVMLLRPPLDECDE